MYIPRIGGTGSFLFRVESLALIIEKFVEIRSKSFKVICGSFISKLLL